MTGAWSQRISAAVLGATGAVGQRMVSLLADHPWFELGELVASERSAGRAYGEAVSWRLPCPLPDAAARLVVRALPPTLHSRPKSTTGGLASTPPHTDDPLRSRVLFSALDADLAGPVEEVLAAAGHAVVSNAKSHRLDPDVPLVIPEVNGGHMALIGAQRRRLGTEGFIVTNPNCSATGLTMALAAIEESVGVDTAVVATLQAVSGAGYPGLPSLDILDNVVPFIAGEEEKLEREPLKMLGRLSASSERINEAGFTIAAMVHRVPVVDGHLVSALVRMRREASLDSIRRAWVEWSRSRALGLPSAPAEPLIVLDAIDRPQTRLDRDAAGGMATTIGRVRSAPGGGIRFTCVAHNTLRGAAGAAVLNAELLVREGYLP